MLIALLIFLALAFCVAGHFDLDETKTVTPNQRGFEERCLQSFLDR